MTAPDPMLVGAIEDLWRIPRPGPDNLLAAPRFIALRDLCAQRFNGGKAPFALSTALRALGMPCYLPKGREDLKLDAADAAAWIEAAFRQETTVRRHLCPLDLADDFLPISFGAAGLARFTAGHMTTIEAALGLELDHRGKLRPKGSPHPNVTPARRVAARVAAALGDAGAANEYLNLFELRSAFVHGRGGMQAIPSAQRVMARSLARRAAGSLVALAAQPARPRAEILADLLDKGVPMLPPP